MLRTKLLIVPFLAHQQLQRSEGSVLERAETLSMPVTTAGRNTMSFQVPKIKRGAKLAARPKPRSKAPEMIVLGLITS